MAGGAATSRPLPAASPGAVSAVAHVRPGARGRVDRVLTDLLWAGVMLAVSVAIHAAVIARLLRTLARTPAGELPLGRLTARLIGVAARLVASHLLQVACWGTYFTLAGAFGDLPTATYFSMVT